VPARRSWKGGLGDRRATSQRGRRPAPARRCCARTWVSWRATSPCTRKACSRATSPSTPTTQVIASTGLRRTGTSGGCTSLARWGRSTPSVPLPNSPARRCPTARRGATARRGDRVPAHRRAVGCPAVLHPRPRPPARPPRESPSQVPLASHPRSDQRAQRLTSRFRSAPLPEPEGGEHHNGIGQQSARPLTEWNARRPSDGATRARSVAKGRLASERPRNRRLAAPRRPATGGRPGSPGRGRRHRGD